MAFLKAAVGHDQAPVIRGQGVCLRPPMVSDYPAWAELRALSREHLRPWEPEWASDELTRGGFRRRLRHHQREQREGLSYAFVILEQTGAPLIGGLTLSNVRRGVAQCATLGYWLGLPFVGRGFMTEAVRAALCFAFEVLRLHRVEAATMPANLPSIRVLERTGFAREGLAQGFLKINGAWEDHILFSRLPDGAAGAEGRSRC